MISIISLKEDLLSHSHLYVLTVVEKICNGPTMLRIDMYDDIMDWNLYRDHRSFVMENLCSPLNLLRKGL